VTVAPGYTRSVLMLTNELLRPLNDSDAEALVGSEMTISLHDEVVSQGVVTNAVVVDNGRRLQVTLEAGGPQQ
jgi:hypothetical protein